MTTSAQTRHVWKRFCAWYGADVIERKYGTQAPDDWADVIDAIERNRLEGVLANVRAKYPTWPPSLYEFEQLAKAKPTYSAGPTMQEQLCASVLARRTLSDAQLRMPWTYLHSGNSRSGEGLVVTGVIVPADGDIPGHHVMVTDMLAGAA